MLPHHVNLDLYLNKQTKYQKALAEHNKALSSMNKELTTLRDSHNAYKAKLRDMELDNDELENAER